MIHELQPLLENVRAALPRAVQLYLVGGAVRDMLLGRNTHDLDFVLPRQAIQAARKVADALGGDFYALDMARDTGRVLVQREGRRPLVMDFAGFRGADLDADLHDRDFTINAIALDLSQPDALIDPLNGGRDLRMKVIRMCSPASFESDPVRILRCVRQAVEFGFKIEPETLRRLREAAASLFGVSPERLRDELFKILEGPGPAAGLRMLDMLGAIQPVLPEVEQMKAVGRSFGPDNGWEHALGRVNRMSALLDALKPEHNPEEAANWTMGLVSMRIGRYRQQLNEHLSKALNPNRSPAGLLLFAALFMNGEGNGEAARTARERGEALRLSKLELDRLETALRHGRRPELLAQAGEPPNRREVYRFFRDTGQAGVDTCLLSLADVLSAYGAELPQKVWVMRLDTVRTLLEAWWEAPKERISPPALISGHDLLAQFGLSAGPKVGRVLEAVREAQAAGEVVSREEALELAGNLVGKSLN